MPGACELGVPGVVGTAGAVRRDARPARPGTPWIARLLLLLGLAVLLGRGSPAGAGAQDWRNRYRDKLNSAELRNLDSPLEAELELLVNQIRSRGLTYRGRRRRLSRSDKTSISVYDLTRDRQLVSINQDTSRMAASLIKLYVMLLYYDRVAAGRIRHTNRNISWLRSMIRDSSNVCTNRLLRKLGGPAAAQKLLRRRYPQFSHTRIVEYIPSGGRTYRNRTSTRDLTRFWRALWSGKLPHSRRMKILLGLRNRDRLISRTAIPKSARIWDKTGSVYGLCADAGIISYRDPRTGKEMAFAISVLIEDRSKVSRRNRKDSYKLWLGFRSAVIRKLSERVFDYLHRDIFGRPCPGISR